MPTGIQLSSGVVVGQPIPLDAKFGPYNSTTEALDPVTGVALGLRHRGLTVGVFEGGVLKEYWFKDGTANGDFVAKSSDVTWDSLPGKPSTFAPSAHTHAISDVTNLQTTLDGKQASGFYATLVNGTVPSTQLPSYVDAVLEFANLAAFPANGETGIIYVTLDTNKTYRWSGSAYVEISASSTLAHAATHHTGGTDALTPANIGAARSVTILDLSSDDPFTILTAQLPALGIITSDNDEQTFTINLPTPTAQQSGLTFSIKRVEGVQEPNATFYTLNHAGVALVTSGELDSTEGSVVFTWDGYRWVYDAAYLLRSFPGRVLQLPAVSGTLAVTSHTHSAANITDSTSVGRALLTAADAAAQRTLLNVADGAEVNVNANWTAASGDAQILNKPTLFPPSAGGWGPLILNRFRGNTFADSGYAPNGQTPSGMYSLGTPIGNTLEGWGFDGTYPRLFNPAKLLGPNTSYVITAYVRASGIFNDGLHCQIRAFDGDSGAIVSGLGDFGGGGGGPDRIYFATSDTLTTTDTWYSFALFLGAYEGGNGGILQDTVLVFNIV